MARQTLFWTFEIAVQTTPMGFCSREERLNLFYQLADKTRKTGLIAKEQGRGERMGNY
jgi:hypothetical protein